MLRRNGPVIKPWSQSWSRKGVYGGKDCEKGRWGIIPRFTSGESVPLSPGNYAYDSTGVGCMCVSVCLSVCDVGVLWLNAWRDFELFFNVKVITEDNYFVLDGVRIFP